MRCLLSDDNKFELGRRRPDLEPDVDDEHGAGGVEDGGQRADHRCDHGRQHQPSQT